MSRGSTNSASAAGSAVIGYPGEGVLGLRPGRSRKSPDPDNYYDQLGAAMIRALRHRYPSVGAFAAAIASELGWPHLSRQAVYDWEMARSRVPLTVILAACTLDQRRLDDAFRDGFHFMPPQIHRLIRATPKPQRATTTNR